MSDTEVLLPSNDAEQVVPAEQPVPAGYHCRLGGELLTVGEFEEKHPHISLDATD